MTKKERIKYQDWVVSYRKSLTAHFVSRCKLRLNWAPSNTDINNIHSILQGVVPDNCIGIIDTEEAKKLNVRSINGRRWYFIIYCSLQMDTSIKMWICYDKKVRNVITALPHDDLPTVSGSPFCEIIGDFNKSFDELNG